ncbi:uncharacterized protein VNE69_02111 [Vairimorpha necatrix]|uniref:Uncharacterized protein n=1 Tax=Vairimorpha necatrix TaxID=6039 RepID=A0AAX4J9E5_9MICR
MFLFHSLLITSSLVLETSEHSVVIQFNQQMNKIEDIDIMTILAEEHSGLPQEDYIDPTMEELFEHLISGGSLNDLYDIKSQDTLQHIYNAVIENPSSIINCIITLENQLNQMKYKLYQIKEESKSRYVQMPNLIHEHEFGNDEITKLMEYRTQLRRFFLKYEKSLFEYSEYIKEKYIKIPIIYNEVVVSTFNFFIDVCDFIIPINSHLSVRYNTMILLNKFLLDHWKIQEVLNTIYLPNLIEAIIIYCKSMITYSGKDQKEFNKHLKTLLNNFKNFYDEKDDMCIRLYEPCRLMYMNHMSMKENIFSSNLFYRILK